MTEVSINPDQEVLKEVAEDEVTQETAVAPPMTMAIGQMSGDVAMTDLKFPRLQIAYGVGGLASNFTPGDIVLDKEHQLVKKKTPLRVIIVNTVTYWKEYTAFGSGAIPRVFKTAEEVSRAGLTTTWVNGMAPQAKKAMDLRLLIKKPEGLICGLFGIKLDGGEYAPALWSVDKTAYDRINDKLTPVAGFALREKGLLYGAWDVSTDMETRKNGNVVVVPVLKYVGMNSDQLVNEIKALFGAK